MWNNKPIQQVIDQGLKLLQSNGMLKWTVLQKKQLKKLKMEQ